MAKSQKPQVIERIFDLLYDPATGTLSKTVVTAPEVQEAKRWCNENLGTTIKLDSNPYNFMKDIVRSTSGRKAWPQRIRDLGWTGVQRTGGSNVFEFVPVAEEESDTIDFQPTESTPTFPIQSLSLPLASRQLGRKDEPWLLQVTVNLRVIETHFAVGENRQIEALEINHLQMDLKLRDAQIDALFLAKMSIEDSDAHGSVLITVEAKQGNQLILTEQIARQVREAFNATRNDLVIPTAVVGVRNKGIYVVEFKAVQRSNAKDFKAPVFHRDAMFVLQPHVKGI
jgi:ribonuclease P protein component